MLYGSFSEKTVSFDLLLKGFMEGNSFKLMNAAAISLAVKFLFVIVKGIYIMFVNYAREYSAPKIADAEGCHASTVINCFDDDWGEVYLTGGTYVNMDPSDVHEWRKHHVSFVVDGYKVVSEDKGNGEVWYTVVAE